MKLAALLLALSTCGTAQVPAPATPAACPKGSTVVVVGDSITGIAADHLDAQLTAAGYVPEINARGGRTIAEGLEPVLGYTYPTSEHRCWVVALGTNDAREDQPLTAATSAALTDLLSRLPWQDDLWWMRVAVPGGEAVNAAIPADFATMINWRPNPADLYDGTHPNDAGVHGWTDAVLAALTAPA